MKLGNISQTIVQVPNFFMNRKYNPMDTFQLHNKTETNIKINTPHIKKKHLSFRQKMKTELEIESNLNSKNKSKKKYLSKRNSTFTETKLLTTYKDLNINNNPRYKDRLMLNLNKEKYIPNYYLNNRNNKTEINETFFPEIVDMNSPENKIKKKKKLDTYTIMTNFYNYKKYKESTDINKLLSPDLRNELMNDTKNLIDRINMNYDLKEWNKFDSRTTSNRLFQTDYSPISNVAKTTPNIRDKFIETINKKAMGLTTINKQVKKNNIKFFNNENNEEKNKEDKKEKSLDEILNKTKSNLIKLKYNNASKLKYNENDKMFIKENEYITKRLNKTKLYKDFPSKTREEFNVKKIFKYKEMFKMNEPLKNIIKKQKYGDDNIFNNSNKKVENNTLQLMWIRPLHKDAFKLHK